MKSIAVYCGSMAGTKPIFKESAYKLGVALAKRNIELIYGGAKVGLMGAVANGVLEAGGKSTGVLPQFLEKKELKHEGLTQLVMVEGMHERKAMMSKLAEGFIALPGGFGTMEELFEMLTWAQLDLHQKPIALLNIEGFYDAFLTFMEVMIKDGFLNERYRKIVLVSDDIENLLAQMNNYTAPTEKKWADFK